MRLAPATVQWAVAAIWTVSSWLCALPAYCQSRRATDFAVDYIRFDDIAPKYLTLTQSWSAVGVDDQDRAYIIWTSKRDDGREDAALFRYTRADGSREFLGTFIDVAARQQNLLPGEELPKGHTPILQVGRKLYMASQGFHDFKRDQAALSNYRGAHLFSYDLDSGAFDDVSRTLPHGVLIEHQGIITLAYSPEHNLLVGLAHPLGDIVLFDVARGSARKVVHGIPWQPRRAVSREIVVTRKGKIFSYRGPEGPVDRDQENEVWVYDIAKDTMRPTGQLLKGGFWNGQATTRDRSKTYLSTVSGELYVLDVERETFTHLAHFAGDHVVRYLFGIALSAGEDFLIGAPLLYAPGAVEAGPDTPMITRLTTYALRDRTLRAEIDLDAAVFTGSDHRDSLGNIYMSAFDWNTHCKLAVLYQRARNRHASRQRQRGLPQR